MWTPFPARELRTAGKVAVRVLPSPVLISAIEPSWSTMPPISCTSKWRWPRARLPASRVRAKDSGSSSSSASPLRARSRRASALSRSSSSLSRSSSASQSPIRATRRSNSLNFFPSPIRRARSSSDIPFEASKGTGPRKRDSEGRKQKAESGFLRCCRARFDLGRDPPAALLVAVALDLAGHLVGRQVHGLHHARRGVARAQRRPLQPQRQLGYLRVGDRGVLLLGQLDVALGHRGHLLADLLEALLDPVLKLVADHNVAPLHLDAHAALLVAYPPLRMVRPGR